MHMHIQLHLFIVHSSMLIRVWFATPIALGVEPVVTVAVLVAKIGMDQASTLAWFGVPVAAPSLAAVFITHPVLIYALA